jgi:hypothetical protein
MEKIFILESQSINLLIYCLFSFFYQLNIRVSLFQNSIYAIRLLLNNCFKYFNEPSLTSSFLTIILSTQSINIIIIIILNKISLILDMFKFILNKILMIQNSLTIANQQKITISVEYI